MITDRKKFLFSFPGTSVKRVQWLKKGEQRQAYRPNNPMVVNMYAGITKHGVTKAQVGLANAENTADLAKPVSTATQTAGVVSEGLTAVPEPSTASRAVRVRRRKAKA